VITSTRRTRKFVQIGGKKASGKYDMHGSHWRINSGRKGRGGHILWI